MQKKQYILLFSLFSVQLAASTGQSFYLGRPQGVNAARELVGWESFINRDADECYHEGVIDVTYAQSFNPCRISQFLFQNGSLNISGSAVANRGSLIFLLIIWAFLPILKAQCALIHSFAM